MGRADYRKGRAPIRSATELAELLPGTIYLLATGLAGPLFPNNGRPAPSLAVKVIPLAELPPALQSLESALPIWVHWTQWENVVVPIMSDARTLQWAKQFSPRTVTDGVVVSSPDGGWGQPLPLPNDVVGPDGEVVYSEGDDAGMARVSLQLPSPLYASKEYIEAMAGIIQVVAENAGY